MKAIVKSIIIAGTIAGFAVVTAFTPAPTNLNLGKDSRLWIDGTSTVRSFKCSAAKVDVSVIGEPTAAPEEIVKSASLSVPVAQLDCGNNTMNEHMRKALKAEKFEKISWTMTSYQVQGSNVIVGGKLTIAGKENPIELKGTGSAVNGVIRFKGSKQFRMTEYGVKPPSLMLGTMKVGDPITVSFDLVLSE
jgi:polyisoprenoid-binding protein YceI